MARINGKIGEGTTIRTKVYGWEDTMTGGRMIVGMTKIEGRFPI
jgi:hypothetical protein